jgi:hypothetical protein
VTLGSIVPSFRTLLLLVSPFARSWLKLSVW